MKTQLKIIPKEKSKIIKHITKETFLKLQNYANQKVSPTEYTKIISRPNYPKVGEFYKYQNREEKENLLLVL